MSDMHIKIGMLPMISWMNGIATGVVLLIGLGIALAMFFLIRIATSDSDRHKELREFVETLFGTPAHLRPENGSDAPGQTAAAKEHTEAFTEPCPGCSELVTEIHTACPSCGLRLQ